MLYLLGSLGINPFSISAPSTVLDYTPSVWGVTGGDGGKKPHNVGSLTRTSGVCALDNETAVATPPVVHRDIYSMYPSSLAYVIIQFRFYVCSFHYSLYLRTLA